VKGIVRTAQPRSKCGEASSGKGPPQKFWEGELGSISGFLSWQKEEGEGRKIGRGREKKTARPWGAESWNRRRRTEFRSAIHDNACVGKTRKASTSKTEHVTAAVGQPIVRIPWPLSSGE